MAGASNYIELASPNVVHHRWKELVVDVASAQSTLQDISLPECVGGFSYLDTKTIGSPCYNRYIYWRTSNELLEMLELSSEFILTNNQIRIKFVNAPIINSIKIIELSNSLLILIATLSSVHRIALPHPKLQVATQLASTKQFVANSIFSSITNELLSDNRTFFVLNGHSANVPASGVANPMSGASWLDEAPDLVSFALAYPNGSIHIVRFNHNIDSVSTLEASMNSLKSDSPVTSWELKNTSIIGRIWSRIPTLLAKNQHESEDAALSCVAARFEEANDMILFALCRDYKLRIWSTKYRELTHSYSLIAQPLNQSMSTSQSRLTLVDLSNQQLVLRVTGKNTKDMLLAIYMTEQEPEFIVLQHKYDFEKHRVEELCILKAPEWDCLIDFAISKTKIWAVALNRDNDYVLYWLNLDQLNTTSYEHRDPSSRNNVNNDEWHSVYLNEDPENLKPSKDHQYQIVEEIFWRNKFSMSTILKGISILGRGSSDVKLNQDDIQALVDTASSIIRNNLNEVKESRQSDLSLAEREAWYKFHTYCVQNHQVANKVIGLLVSDNEETVALLKRGNSSIIVPAPSKIALEFQGPYAGIKLNESSMNNTMKDVMDTLSYINQQIVTEDMALTIEQKLLDEPIGANQFFQNLASSLLDSDRINTSRIPFISENSRMTSNALKDLYSSVFASLQTICNNLDMTTTRRYDFKKISTRSVTFHPFLTSNHGIAATYELIKKMIKSRYILARDMTVLLHLLVAISMKETKKSKIQYEELSKFCEELYLSSIVSKTTDCLRCYRILLWISESPIKTHQKDIKLATLSTLQQLSEKFEFMKLFNSSVSALANPANSKRQLQKFIEPSIQRNLLTDFLINGGQRIAQLELKKPDSTLSKCDLVTVIANSVCQLLWPKNQHNCFAEYLLCSLHQDHLFTYLELLDNWTHTNEHDRFFLKAFNHLLCGESSRAVTLFNRLCMSMSRNNLIARFIDIDNSIHFESNQQNNQIEKNTTNASLLNESGSSQTNNEDYVEINTNLIYKYFENLIQIFKLNDYAHDIITLIKHCIPLLSESPDISSFDGSHENLATTGHSSSSDQRINGLRTQLFKYNLDLDMTEEAYHAFVLNTDRQQCSNCLHQFIVYHCERERWQELLLFPFLELRDEFVQVIEQRASNSDLLKIAENDFIKPSYYEILYSYWMMEYEFKRAASCMYKYAQRLGHEVPGIASVKKQADCLLIVLNCLNCLDDRQEMFLEVANVNGIPESDEQSHGNMLKRGYDCDVELPASPSNSNVLSHSTQLTTSKYQSNAIVTLNSSKKRTTIDITDLEKNYELTKARLILLKKDPNINTIALSPLNVEETISYLVSSSMFTYAADLAILLKSPLEPVLKGLVEKFISLSRLCPTAFAHDHNLRQSLSDCLSASYSCIEISNLLTNSNKSSIDKLWLLIDYYLDTYDGISHMCSDASFAQTYSKATVLMNVVATSLLSSGYDVPASLKRRYMHRNPSELLRLLIKYDQLPEAADLCVEMVNLVIEPANLIESGIRPIYLPTHLILLLIEYLNEDATNKEMTDIGHIVKAKLTEYRSCIALYSTNHNTSGFH